MTTEQIRNKYNTLTPAEAKKLNRYLGGGVGGGGRPPLRTASVLRRPRAPPIVVTDLDNTIEKQLLDNGNKNCFDGSNNVDGQFVGMQNHASRNRQSCDRRHSINYGNSATLASRHSLFSTALSSASTKQTSPYESLSNLSFRSSQDTTDCAHDSSRKFQTMSVDLGARRQGRPISAAYDGTQARLRMGSQRSNTISTKFSDDSFCSARTDVSHVSNRSSSATPTKYSHFPPISNNAPRCASKMSLSSSTYKVFQSPLANFKRLFRGIQRPFSHNTANTAAAQNNTTKTYKHEECGKSLADTSLSDSISQLSLNKSQSPTVLPPPPSELKSMCYLESGINYSNYDDFTKTRNERLTRGNLRNFINRSDATRKDRTSSNTFGSNNNNNNNNTSNQDHQSSLLNKSDESDDSVWQMTSLPVYYERNLTTVFEERQPNSISIIAGSNQAQITPAEFESDLAGADGDGDGIYQTIKPPKRFDDADALRVMGGLEISCDRAPSVDSSRSQPHSIAVITDSVLEIHRQQPATPFRFSFAQPLSDTQQMLIINRSNPHPLIYLVKPTQHASLNATLGLPPRAPTSYQQTTTTTINSENQRQDNSSSGNSSNCSSQMNGINYCDRQNSLESSAPSTLQTIDKLSYSLDSSSGGYGNMQHTDNDADATLLSEASTIRGETGAMFYINKCAELERTIVSLKDKLIAKEKELTELQLAQLNNDYTIERLKKQVNKVERENTQLRAMVARGSNNTTSIGSNTISRMQI